MKSGNKLPMKQRITIGKFQNIDLRVAKILSAPMAVGTDKPCRFITVSAGHLGEFTSIGQFSLIEESDLLDKNCIVCCNFAPRKMGDKDQYDSQVLVLGAPHPDSPPDQEQAIPLIVLDKAIPGDSIY